MECGSSIEFLLGYGSHDRGGLRIPGKDCWMEFPCHPCFPRRGSYNEVLDKNNSTGEPLKAQENTGDEYDPGEGEG